MGQKQIQIRIFSDGTIKSHTKNIKGKSCLKYMNMIEELCNAKAIDSEFTTEYYESEQIVETEQEMTEIVKETNYE
ncbi:MAG: DUF2997 domain-containing protein [Butyrivibrio sp.]|jgi:hypothetical protein|nr:DUF2997 domain-containing protein [Butyrivibrio sp.]